MRPEAIAEWTADCSDTRRKLGRREDDVLLGSVRPADAGRGSAGPCRAGPLGRHKGTLRIFLVCSRYSSGPGSSGLRRERRKRDMTLGAEREVGITPRVVIAHDYLTQRGGAERVVLAMLRAFPGARVVTSVYAPNSTYPEFRDHQIESSWLTRVGAFRKDPRLALPLLAPTWSRLWVRDAHVVLCSSTGWAHGVRTDAPKLVYCHNPARWLYQSSEYLAGVNIGLRAAQQLLAPPLRAWDKRSALSADRYLVNSSVVATRVRRIYGIDATVLHPPVGIEPGPDEPVAGIEPGYLLTVGRARGYKNTSAIAEAVERLPDSRLVCVGGLPPNGWSHRVVSVSGISDGQLRWLYRNARALVACAYEDFGLTPIEAYAFGTPALVLRAGGYLDTTVAGVTGEFIESADVDAIIDGIGRILGGSYNPAAIRRHAELFSLASFVERLRAAVHDLIGSRRRASS